MGTMGAQAKMSFDKSGRHTQICHVRENRRGISEETWTMYLGSEEGRLSANERNRCCDDER